MRFSFLQGLMGLQDSTKVGPSRHFGMSLDILRFFFPTDI